MRGMVVRVRVGMMELVGDAGDGRKMLERGESGVRVGEAHTGLAHGHRRVQVSGERRVCPVIPGTLQDGSHAGDHS